MAPRLAMLLGLIALGFRYGWWPIESEVLIEWLTGTLLTFSAIAA
jgi:hypothetical protein